MKLLKASLLAVVGGILIATASANAAPIDRNGNVYYGQSRVAQSEQQSQGELRGHQQITNSSWWTGRPAQRQQQYTSYREPVQQRQRQPQYYYGRQKQQERFGR